MTITCVCGHPQGMNQDDCERCRLLAEISDLKFQIQHCGESPTFAAKLANYLYARLRQGSGRYDRNDIEIVPEWVPCRVRIDWAIHNNHPFPPGFILAGEHDCSCGIDGRIYAYSDTKVKVRIPVCDCEILDFAPNTLRELRVAEVSKTAEGIN